MWHKSGISLHVSRRLVVLGVGETPRVEGNQEEGVHDQSHGVIEHLVPGESTVSALVCQNPDTGKDTSCRKSVRRPGSESKICVGEERDVGEGEVAEGAPVEEIADDVCHGSKDGGLEAMGGDSIVDLLHGEVRQLEDLAVEIEVLAIAVPFGRLRQRGGSCLSSHIGYFCGVGGEDAELERD